MKMHPSPGINSTFKIVPGCVALQRGSGAPIICTQTPRGARLLLEADRQETQEVRISEHLSKGFRGELTSAATPALSQQFSSGV